MKVYLSGPMNGYPLFNFSTFHAAAYTLRRYGYTVISPAEYDENVGFNPHLSEEDQNFNIRKTFLWCIQQILDSEAVILLNGWEKSKGSTAEAAVARAVNMPIFTIGQIIEISKIKCPDCNVRPIIHDKNVFIKHTENCRNNYKLLGYENEHIEPLTNEEKGDLNE